MIRAPRPALAAPLPPPAATFAVDYREGPLDALLADPRLLAVFGFGDQAPPIHDDPRYLHVALPAPMDAPFECWQVDQRLPDVQPTDRPLLAYPEVLCGWTAWSQCLRQRP